MMKYQEESKYIGCLLGGAIGDSIGGVVEFMSYKKIRSIFGKKGIQDFGPSYGLRYGAITDDTQMTLFTADGLLTARSRHLSPVLSVWRSYQDWFTTQIAIKYSTKLARTPLMRNEFLWSRRAPGSTCMGELGQRRAGTVYRGSMSKGCGGVMRVAPAGLLYDGGKAYKVGCDTAALTHGHVDGYAPAGALAVIISELRHGFTIEQAVDTAISYLPYGSRSRTLLCKAVELAGWGPVSQDTVQRLGQGWTGDEALAIGAYCAMATHDFEKGVLLAVNHSGDSDSTGSIAGQILGAAYGWDAIPDHWRYEVEGADVIADMAVQLYNRAHK